MVAIDLTEVELVDRDAVTLLARTEGNGIELRNCPAYICHERARQQLAPRVLAETTFFESSRELAARRQ